MHDQKRWDALPFGHMSHRGEIDVLRRIIAELFPMPKLGLRFVMHPATCLCGFDDRRDVVGVAIHRHATDERSE